MDNIPEAFAYTLSVFNQLSTAMRDDLPLQMSRRIGDTLVSVVRPLGYDWHVMDELNRRTNYTVNKGEVQLAGCAIGTVPDGPDVYVTVLGLSDDANTLAAQYYAQQAAALFTGASYV